MARQANRGDAPRRSEPGRERLRGIERAKLAGFAGMIPLKLGFLRARDSADGTSTAFFCPYPGCRERRRRGFGGRRGHYRKTADPHEDQRQDRSQGQGSPYHAADPTVLNSPKN
jgi:hypothetical protein